MSLHSGPEGWSRELQGGLLWGDDGFPEVKEKGRQGTLPAGLPHNQFTQQVL
jgi:hypothetical protein